MKQLGVSVIFFLVFVILSGVSLFGVLIPDNTPKRIVGPMQIGIFETGITLFQNNQRTFYIFSPFNDYQIDSDGRRSAFISVEQILNREYSTDFRQDKWTGIFRVIGAYFHLISPQMTFYTPIPMTYTTDIKGNVVNVNLDVSARANNDTRTIGMTIPFEGGSFIFNKRGILYNYQIERDRTLFEQTYDIPLNDVPDQLRIPVESEGIIMFSPHLASALVIRAQEGQRIWVNRDFQLIEVEEQITPEDGSYNMSLQIEVYNNPEEAYRFL